MRWRWRRVVRGGVVVASLGLCAAAAALWARSYSGSDYVERTVAGPATAHSVSQRYHRVQWTMGQVRLARGEHVAYLPPNYAPPAAPPPERARWTRNRLGKGHMGGERIGGGPRSWWTRFGVWHYRWGTGASFFDQSEEGVAAPAWWLVVVFGVIPAAFAWQVWKRGRVRPGLCAACGYDLRATPERCPECGAVAAREKAQG